MKIACQEGLAPGASLEEKLDNLAGAGFDGIELRGAELAGRVDDIRRAVKDHPVKPVTICGGIGGCILDASKKERDIAFSDIARLLEIAGELNMVGVILAPIFGPPRLPDLSPLQNAVSLETDLLTKLCEELGEIARRANSTLLLEPLNRYETHLLRTLADGVDIVQRVGNPHVKIMADFFHMSIEEADIPASIRNAGLHIAHCHLADSNRQLPGYGHTDFRAGFSALKEVGFGDYMALECGNPEQDPMVGLRRSADFLKAQLA